MPHKKNFYEAIIKMILNNIDEQELNSLYLQLPPNTNIDIIFNIIIEYLNCNNISEFNILLNNFALIIKCICNNFSIIKEILNKKYNFNNNFIKLIKYINLYINQNQKFNPVIKNNLDNFKTWLKNPRDLFKKKYFKYKFKYYNLTYTLNNIK